MSYTAKDIEVLSGRDHVRLRPAMYIPNTSKEGLNHLCLEILDNSLDEVSAGFGKKISIVLHKDSSVEIEDEGRGIPCEIHPKEGIPTLDVVLTQLNAGGKFSKSGYSTASSLAGLHGVGSSVVSALSEWMKAYVKRDGKEYHREYARGEVVGDPLKLSEKKIKDSSTGTKIIFKPDSQIFKTLKFDEHTIIHRLKELSYLFKGITFEFKNLRDDKPVEIFMSQNGIADYLDTICEDKDGIFPEKPIVFEGKAGNTVAEIAIKYSSDLGETCISFCNGIHTIDQGTHVSGFRKAFTRALNAHGKEFKIIPEKEENLSGDDLRDGMNCIIAVKVKEPQFAGQSKAKLNNPEVESEVGEIIFSQAVDYLKSNQALAKKILEAALATRRARQAAKKQTELMRRKSVFGKTTLPGKLIDCASEKQEETELFIVEGLSAVGTARDARDAKYQALLPLKGKIISSEKQTLEKVLENQEIQDILSSIGLPIEQFGTDNINLAKLRYGKIIFMFDADEDGSHIATLSMAMFLKYMRPLIENGMVYIVQAPLYTVKTSDKKVYCYNKQEMEKAMAKMPKAQVVRNKGLGENSAQELADTCMNPKTRRVYQIDLPDLAEANKLVKVFMGTNTADRKKILFGDN